MLNRVSLNTIGLNRIGLNRIGKPSRASSDRPYIDPEVLASLKAVCICYGKSNDDPDRAVVKNLVDPDNPFVISNAAFKLNSGFGFYTNFRDAGRAEIEVLGEQHWLIKKVTNVIPEPILIEANKFNRYGYLLRIKCSGIVNTTDVYTNAGGSKTFLQNGINIIDAKNEEVYSSGYIVFGIVNDATNIEIQILPEFEGAFVTDGVDDMITSTKTVKEMLVGSNECTVVSMMANLDSRQIMCNSNFSNTNGYNVRNTLEPNGVISILGYTDKNGTTNNLNLIMGDKNSIKLVDKVNFNSDYVFHPSSYNVASFKTAWYWTIIANKVLTTDQINQVIAYFNLDRTLNPDILCDVKKQGITNENHAEFGDKLIDFSGNGRDIQLNNIAWKGDSGIGKYEVDFSTWSNKPTETFHSKSILEAGNVLRTKSAASSMKVKVQFDKEAIGLSFRYFEGGVSKFIYINSNGEYSLPPLEEVGVNEWEGFSNNSSSNVTITQIPSHAGALCLDGVNDFGKVTGMPVYKDYTVVTDREIFANIGAILSKNNPGAFVETAGNSVYSFGQATSGLNFISIRSISYLSKYSYCGQSITAGAAEDGTDMWLGTIRDNDSHFFNGAIYSLMSFPYSMSEFLIERQLKKHKLGTLYPDMVEFRPIVKSNLPYSSITYSVNPGEYISVDSMVTITVTLPNTSDKLMEVSCNAISDISISGDNGVYEITGKIVKSPQKINLVISSYLTMLNNETLISNETLIKNE